ncbi:MAG: stage II sporulation protein P [Lachnospiraceae bacterium]|nr:stage II sporulation protein P [Lachnospiraceae bacterium]
MKNGEHWFQRLIWGLILAVGFYIIYRGSGILAESGGLERFFGMLGSDGAAEAMQEMAADTYLPGYQAALEQASENGVLKQWLDWIVPVLWEYYKEAEAADQEEESGTDQAETESNQVGNPSEQPQESQIQNGMDSVDEVQVQEETTENQSTEETTENQSTEEAAENQSTEETTEAVTDIILDAETDAEPDTSPDAEQVSPVSAIPAEKMAQLEDFNYLLNNYFIVDADTVPEEEQMNVDALLSHDLSLEKNPEVPQILIYHTHSQETFLDSVEGNTDDTIIGMGAYLASLLEHTYGYQVIHDTGVYDLVDGVLDRSAAYDYAREAIEPILEENPTIEVVIDLHRDGVEGKHFVTDINGKQTSQIMFFNGLSRSSSGQDIDYLYNPYTEENLAFSFQLQLAAEKNYPGFTRNIYLKGQRFNLHFRPRSLLIEAGTQLNTVEEERNAMEPLADILNQVLSGS